MGRRFRVFLLFFFIATTVANASFLPNPLHLRHLTVNNGLSTNRVSCIYRDSKDYLWVGTNNGLNRYDGTFVTVYNSVHSDNSTISNSDISCIFEDRDHNLWVGTKWGLNCFNYKTETFVRFRSDFAIPTTISHNYITDIVQDKKGTIWVTTYSGLNKIDAATKTIERFYLTGVQHESYINSYLSMEYDSAKNVLWFGTRGDALLSFDVDNELFELHKHPLLSSTFTMHKRIVLEKDNVWIGTDAKGVLVYNTTTKDCKALPIESNGKGTSGKEIACAYKIDDHTIAFGVNQGGLNLLNLSNMQMSYYRYDKQNPKGLNNDGIMAIFTDMEDILYIGTSAGGVNIYNPKENQFVKYQHNQLDKNSLTFNIVYTLFEDSKGLVWIGTDGGGVSVFDPIEKRFTNYAHQPGNPSSLSGDAVLSIAEDVENNIWLGTWANGLNKYDRGTAKFHRVKNNINNSNGLSNQNIMNLILDDDGKIWITCLDNGTAIFDIEKGILDRFNSIPNDSTSLASDYVRKIFKLGSQIGFATSLGFSTWQPQFRNFKRWKTLDAKSVNDAILDSNGNFWFATTENELIKIEPTGAIKTYDKKNGLIAGNLVSIIEDNQQNIWISSYTGLVKFDTKTNEFHNNLLYDIDSERQFVINTALKTREGIIYLGGFDGMYVFNPNTIKTNSYLPKVYITDFSIFNKNIMPNDSTLLLKNVVRETEFIKLSHRENVFSFAFTATNFTYTKQTNFAYKLEGYDSDWVIVDYNRRFATYTNIAPGSYTFKVKASNNDNIWSDEIAQIKIVVVPPFWKRWWFKILVVVIVVATLLFYYQRKIREYKRQHRILEDTVWIRTAELREVNADLEHSKAELEQSKEELEMQNEEMQKTNEELQNVLKTKDRLFSIIAHDLKNPFNTIIGFVNVLVDDYSTLNDDEKKNFLDIIKGSSEKAYELIGNLLDWARTQTNRITIKPIAISIVELLYRNIQMVKPMADKKNISIEFEPVKQNAKIFADVNMVDTVVRNLLSNAIKFTPENGEIKIKVNLFTSPGFIDIAISDKGIGIKASQLETLFKIDGAHVTIGTNGETGTGLGLIICKEFVEKNGGSIKVSSTEGEGAEFVISLPCCAT